ncbi:energy-coupling factor transporter transmembrane component T family protein [Actinocorallia populi]|uniref:energy-coupling factor transporter transmembrane component T family protein n=1 Tax=Actinocorallia populi TaxID=2079200 RepID=UPI000D08DF01|nr:energy-coupling factor transporter transmembrane protein EcfT [Actinocorallia populi]
MTGGWYEPGTSPLHRAPAGVKLLVLLALAATVLVLHSPFLLGGVCAVIALGYASARVTPRRCLRLAVTLTLLVAFVFTIQGLLLGPAAALTICLRLVAAFSAAELFTVTTRVDAVVDTVENALRPLRRFGVRPDRVGLTVGLTLQAIAALTTIAAEVRQAAIARNAAFSVKALVVPFLIRTLRHSDELGQALAVRGDDDRP